MQHANLALWDSQTGTPRAYGWNSRERTTRRHEWSATPLTPSLMAGLSGCLGGPVRKVRAVPAKTYKSWICGISAAASGVGASGWAYLFGHSPINTTHDGSHAAREVDVTS